MEKQLKTEIYKKIKVYFIKVDNGVLAYVVNEFDMKVLKTYGKNKKEAFDTIIKKL